MIHCFLANELLSFVNRAEYSTDHGVLVTCGQVFNIPLISHQYSSFVSLFVTEVLVLLS